MMLVTDIIFWYWWVFATVLLAIEILSPGFFFLWLSVSSFIVGLVLWFIPSLTLAIQLLIFALLSIVSIYLWRRYGFQFKQTSDHPLLNQRGQQYVGRSFSLIEAIENGRGRIKVDDSIWTVKGEDSPVGTKVEVIAVKGTVFEVKIKDHLTQD